MLPALALPGDDAGLREETLHSDAVYKGHFLEVRRDQVRMPDGATAQREYIVHPGAVMIVPLLDDGRLVVERQWRYPLHRAMVEFPAGKIDPGEAPLHCGVRELTEETGYTAAEWARAGAMHNAMAYSDEIIEVWFARGLQAGAARPDSGEFLEVGSLDIDELDAMACSGEITDAKTLVGLLWLRRWRAGAWPLVWQQAP